MRSSSYGQDYKFSLVDKLGMYMSTKEVVKFVSKNKPETIVDLGCGYNAVLLNKLKKYSSNLIGVDLDLNPKLKGIKMLKHRISDNLSFLKSNSSDLIILNSVLEHLEHNQDIINETYRALKPGGSLFINVPSWMGKTFLEFSAFKLKLSPIEEINDHKMYYNKEDLWPMLIKAGYKPINIRIAYHKFLLNTKAYAKK